MTAALRPRSTFPLVSRRRVLRAGAMLAAGAAAMPLVGCSDDGDAPAESPHGGGTLRFGTSLPMSYGLDPHLEQGSGLPIIAKAYGYLFHVDPRDDSLIFDHATSVEQPEPGALIIRLGERRFHPGGMAGGRAVLGDDAAQSMLRYRDHPLVLSRWWQNNLLYGMGATDPSTVLVRTSRPYAYSLHEIGQINAGAILPREAVFQQLDLRAGTSGSGPLRIDGTPAPDRVRLARFDGYEAPAYVDAMEWRVFSTDDEKRAAFRERAVDVVAARDRREAEELAGGGVELVPEPSLSWTSIGLRVDRPPFADERVRRALDLALDRDQLIHDAGAGAGDVCGPVNPHLADGYWSLPRDEILGAQGADLTREARIAEARTLLAAAGASDASVSLQVAEVPELRDLAGLVREQLLAAGVSLEITSLPLAAWFFNFRAGAFDATMISHAPHETPDASLRLYHTAGAEGTGNVFGFSSPATDFLIERSWAEEDREQRQSTVLEVQRLMIEARPMLHLFSGTAYSVARSYVRDSGLALPGSLARYAYRQWLDVPGNGRPD